MTTSYDVINPATEQPVTTVPQLDAGETDAAIARAKTAFDDWRDLSPGDRAGETLAKVADWLSAGTQLVWVIDPERRLARVYRADGTERLLEEADGLLGEDVLPGFSCTLASILG